MAPKSILSFARTECETPLLQETTGQLLGRIAGKYPDHEALVAVWQGRRYTYRQFFGECRRAASAFLKLGVKTTGNGATHALYRYFAQIAAITGGSAQRLSGS